MRMTCVTLALLGLVACSEETAEDKCNEFVETISDRAATCGGNRQEFEDGVRGALECSRAVDVASSFDSCMEQIRTLPCGTLFPAEGPSLPTACESVILLR